MKSKLSGCLLLLLLLLLGRRKRVAYQTFVTAVPFNEGDFIPLIPALKDGGLSPLPSRRIQIIHLTIIKLFHRHPSQNVRAAGAPIYRRVCV